MFITKDVTKKIIGHLQQITGQSIEFCRYLYFFSTTEMMLIKVLFVLQK